MSDFLSRYTSGALPPTSHLTDWTWPPLQPPIYFPSARRGQKDIGGTSPPFPPLPTITPHIFPQAKDSSFAPPQPHAHTELSLASRSKRYTLH
ncbi:hypothetical protein GBAR_LOCUS12786 [Geodia barretti]|uniref:Uncharacterized protein n=2 Tax=Geodia barretti TaxID=519541 RepID=A0AA35S1J1_GEOBA|nr:hypothetical protein GBAR_LOCUS12786 [Geodia barretti]